MLRPAVRQRSSQWIVGCNVTRKANVLHNGFHFVFLAANDGSYEFNFLVDHEKHLFIPLSGFVCVPSSNVQSFSSETSVLSSMLDKPIQNRS